MTKTLSKTACKRSAQKFRAFVRENPQTAERVGAEAVAKWMQDAVLALQNAYQQMSEGVLPGTETMVMTEVRKVIERA